VEKAEQRRLESERLLGGHDVLLADARSKDLRLPLRAVTDAR
jgi:hypothetical protein